MIITFLFVSAVSAVTRGSGHYRAAKGSAELVAALSAIPGQEVNKPTSLALVNAGTIDSLAEGKGTLVGGSGKDDALGIVAQLDDDADLFRRQIDARANLFAAVQSDPAKRVELAAQDFAAQINGDRGVRAVVLPNGYRTLPADWRCNVTRGFRNGGLSPVYGIGARAPKRSYGGCGRDSDVDNFALYTAELDHLTANSNTYVIFGGDHASGKDAILRGAMAIRVDASSWDAFVSNLATAADEDEGLFRQLEARSVQLTNWVSQLPAAGSRPTRTPPPKPAKKRRSTSSPSGSPEDGGTVQKKGSAAPKSGDGGNGQNGGGTPNTNNNGGGGSRGGGSPRPQNPSGSSPRQESDCKQEGTC